MDVFRPAIANSVWSQEDYGVLPEFLDIPASSYGYGVRPVDFRGDSEAARVRINDREEEATEERITDLISQDAIDQYAGMALADTIQFRAIWRHIFNQAATAPRAFHLLDGSEREAPMTRQEAKLRYLNGDGCQALELP